MKIGIFSKVSVANKSGDKQSYVLRKGVVLGQNFVTRRKFQAAIEEKLKDSEAYENLRCNISQAKKIIHIIQNRQGKVQSITEFTSDFEKITQLFSQFMYNLGGEISLLTTYNFNQPEQETYFLMNESDLPSQLNEVGERAYGNLQAEVEKLKQQNNKIVQLNKVFKSHLRGFRRQLGQTNLQRKADYVRMKIWSYYNLPTRYEKFKDKGGHFPTSLGYYFWGKGNFTGYTNEAFGSHLALVHPNALTGAHISNLRATVINEHGGPGSLELFELLAATKNNISSQISGDIVVVDKDGTVRFNIQSKASRYDSYKYQHTYKSFLNKIMQFCKVYEEWDSNDKAKIRLDTDALFDAFATRAWVPISDKLSKKIDGLTDKTIKSLMNDKNFTF